MEITVDEPTQVACAEVERRASGLFAQLANAISSKLDAWRAAKKQEREEIRVQDELAVLLTTDPRNALARYAHTPHDDNPSWWVLDDKIAETLRASFHTLPLAEASNVYARLGNQTRIRWDLKRQIKESFTGTLEQVTDLQAKRDLINRQFKDMPDLRFELLAKNGELSAAEWQALMMEMHTGNRQKDFEYASNLSDVVHLSNWQVQGTMPDSLKASLFRAWQQDPGHHAIFRNAALLHREVAALPSKQRRELLQDAVNGPNADPAAVAGFWPLLSSQQKKEVAQRYTEQFLDVLQTPETIAQTLEIYASLGRTELIALVQKTAGSSLSDEMREAFKRSAAEAATYEQQLKNEPIALVSSFSHLTAEDQNRVLDGLHGCGVDVAARDPLFALRYGRRLGLKEKQWHHIMDQTLASNPRLVFNHLDAFGLNKAEKIRLAFRVANALPELDTKTALLILQLDPRVSQELSGEAGTLLSPDRRQVLEQQGALIERVVNSPSLYIRSLKLQVLGALNEAEDPVVELEKMEDVFIRENLPLVGKLLKVFEILYPTERLNAMCKKETVSPVLKASGARMRLYIIYKDLLNVHLRSNNPSLRAYLEAFQDPVLKKVTAKTDAEGRNGLDLANLSTDEKLRVDRTLKKLSQLYQGSQLGKTAIAQGGEAVPAGQLETLTDVGRAEMSKKLLADLQMKPGQTIADRVAEMYLKPLGYEHIEQALAVMDSAPKRAHERSLSLVAGAKNGRLEARRGDLVKWINFEYLTSILQNGSVAQEYLGASSNSDETPFDTDLMRLLLEDEKIGMRGYLEQPDNEIYGELILVVKNRGQFKETNKKMSTEALRADRDVPELFVTGAVDERRHVGIRTGFPTTEIDFMVASVTLQASQKKLNHLFLEIVRNGFYIPVTDTAGHILFTPERYQQIREQTFGGLPLAKRAEFKRATPETSLDYQAKIAQIKKEKRADFREIPKIATELRRLLIEALAPHRLYDPSGDRVDGIKIIETGSTSRFTNRTDAGHRFEFQIEIDPSLTKELPGIQRKLVALLQKDGAIEDPVTAHSSRVRVVDATVAGFNGIDVSVTFNEKPTFERPTSNQTVQEKLTFIELRFGRDAYEDVLANVVLAKETLHAAGIYEVGDGGIGGIGVENWILQHGGSFYKASKAFLAAARGRNGAWKRFKEFQQDYTILDAGVNSEDGLHRNFLDSLDGDAVYGRMLRTLQMVVEHAGLKQEYEAAA